MARYLLTVVLVAALAAPAGAQQQPEPRGLDAVCPQPTPQAGFVDTAGNVHELAIDCLAYYGVTGGVTPTTYGPAGLVRRDQMASFIARFLELIFGQELPAEPAHAFADVAADNPHALRINQLAELGVVGGHADGTYRPAATVRRDQMTAFLNRAFAEIMGREQQSDETFFTDVAGNPHEAHINGLAANGVVTGFPDGTYRPAAPVRRDQMASFVMRQADVVAAGSVTSIYRVRMLGELEIDQAGRFGRGEPDAWGGAVFQLNSRTGRLCYQILAVATGPFTGAHIHVGDMETTGPVHIGLQAPANDTGRVNTCEIVDVDLLVAIEADPTGFYLNVHTQRHPDGAVRGQLATAVHTTYLSWAFVVDDTGAAPVFGRGEQGQDGRAYVQVDPLRERMCVYLELAVGGATPDLTVREGAMAENGPAVLDLEAPDGQGRSSTCDDAPTGVGDTPTAFYLSADGHVRGQLGADALAVPMTAAEAPGGGEPGATGTFHVQFDRAGSACFFLVTTATGPHTGVDLVGDGDPVHTFAALPGGCEEVSPAALAALTVERAANRLVLRTRSHPDGAVAGPVAAGDPWR